jgi:hypothetical protein
MTIPKQAIFPQNHVASMALMQGLAAGQGTK